MSTNEQPLVHGPFKIPENESFYTKAPYDKLNSEKHLIRLIKLLPDNGKGLVECQLRRGSALSDLRGSYAALSYCAGNPSSSQPILSDGKIQRICQLEPCISASTPFLENELS
jgi:hypothetical protein